jgi:hypothetical protein
MYSVAVAAAVVGALLVAPGPAAGANNVGGGFASGDAHFTQPVPRAGELCTSTSFTFAGDTKNGFTVTTIAPPVVSGYAGYLTFSGSGGSACESAEQASGTITLSAQGGSSVRCPSLTGHYVRLLAHVNLTAAGGCTINGVPAQISFTFQGEFVPTNSGGGVTTPVTDATFAGAVAVFPA